MTFPHTDDSSSLTDAELDERAEALWREFIAPCGPWAQTVARCQKYAEKSEAGPKRKWKAEKKAKE